MLRFNPHVFADTLWAMNETDIKRLAILVVLCEATAHGVLRFNRHNLVDTLRTMTEAGIERLTVFVSLCVASAQEVLCFNSHDLADTPWRGFVRGVGPGGYRVNLHDFADTSWAMTP